MILDPNNLIAPMREFVSAIPGSKIVIECKPTYPDIRVYLTLVRIFRYSKIVNRTMAHYL